MQLTPPSPRSLILDLLSTLRERAVPVRALVDAAALFAIQENGLRVALARLLAAGSVTRDERGRYRLAPGAVLTHLLGWRQIEERSAPWSGRWFAVHSAALPRRAGRALRLRERALRFLGFRALLPGFELRPANLRDQLRIALVGFDHLALALLPVGHVTEQERFRILDDRPMRGKYP